MNRSILLNHDFGSLDDGDDGITLLEFEFVSAAACDRALDQILADPDDHMSHDVAQLKFFNLSTQLVSG